MTAFGAHQDNIIISKSLTTFAKISFPFGMTLIVPEIKTCYGLNVCDLPPQISYIKILTSKVMVLGGRAFGRYFSRGVGILSGITAL